MANKPQRVPHNYIVNETHPQKSKEEHNSFLQETLNYFITNNILVTIKN
jgi:hypothetical protein